MKPSKAIQQPQNDICRVADVNEHQTQAGFTLVELAIVLIIVSLLVGGMLMTLDAQIDQQKAKDTQKILSDASDALIGYSAINGRLPCPASSTSNGVESFCTNTGATCGAIILPSISPLVTPPAHGHCSNPYDGFLPGVTLGLPGVDTNGYVTDGWGIFFQPGSIRGVLNTQHSIRSN